MKHTKKKLVKRPNSPVKVKSYQSHGMKVKSHIRTNLPRKTARNVLSDKTDEEIKELMNLGALYKIAKYVEILEKECSDEELGILGKILSLAEAEISPNR